MKYTEVLARLTGFSVPLFGISWNPPEPEVAVARRLLAFLEDRRVLYNARNREVSDHCIRSVLDIRQMLTAEIARLSGDSQLAMHLRAIRAACRRFLDDTGGSAERPRRPREEQFFTALGELRAAVGHHVAAIAVSYGLDIEGELTSILPATDDD